MYLNQDLTATLDVVGGVLFEIGRTIEGHAEGGMAMSTVTGMAPDFRTNRLDPLDGRSDHARRPIEGWLATLRSLLAVAVGTPESSRCSVSCSRLALLDGGQRSLVGSGEARPAVAH